MCCLCTTCGCSTRTLTIVLGIVASLNYFVQLVLILVNDDLFTADFSPEQYNAFVLNHILLLLISLLMLVGAVKENKWLLLPFIIFVSFQAALCLVMTLVTAQMLMTMAGTNGMLSLFFVSLFNTLLLSWVLYIVITFFRLIHYGYRNLDIESAPTVSQQWTTSK